MDLKKFLDRYDPGKDYTFEEIQFRSGAEVTLDWGIYLKESNSIVSTFAQTGLFFDDRVVYFHPAVDRGDPLRQVIFNPFEGRGRLYENVSGYGDVLIIVPTDGDFIARIAHIALTADIRAMISEQRTLPAKCMLGHITNEGQSFGKHSHLEIVSVDEKSEICEYVIKKRRIKEVDILEQILVSKDVTIETKEQIEKYCSPRQIYSFSNVRVQRTDGIACQETKSRTVTYYNSQLVFYGL